MKIEILKFCMAKGVLLDREVGEALSNLSEEIAKEIIERASVMKCKIINKSFFSDNAKNLLGVSSEGYFEKLCLTLGISIEISRETGKISDNASGNTIERDKKRHIKVLYSASNQTKKITVSDFTKYFRERYNVMRAVLQERPELENLVSINKIGNQKQGLSIVGIVYAKRITKNKNLMIEIEDLTGKISILVNQNKEEVYEKAKDIILDTVIGVRGVGNNEMFFVNDIVFPEAVLREKNLLSRDESAAFTSDVHVGSKMFKEKEFLKFLSWLNGEVGDVRQREEALKIKYLFIIGDTIDGIGVYPGQENLLNIKDITEQYKKLASMLRRIRRDVSIILCPGQHDAVRVAEPQPALGREFAYPLHELENVTLVSNPALIEIMDEGRRGIKVLMYHGASMVSIINNVDSLRVIRAHDTPSKVVRHIIKNRHLAPIHSSVTYIPDEKRDELAITEVPDIIATADLHKPDVDIYNNIMIICSSCWQSTTPFEEKVGNHPDPCKVPIVNLRTRAVKIIDFSESDEISPEPVVSRTCEQKGEELVCTVAKEAGK